MAALASDDVEGLRSHIFAAGQPNLNQFFRVVSTGGEVFTASTSKSRELSILAMAAELGALQCARFLVANGATVAACEVEAAFRGGNAELMQQFWDVFPIVNPLEMAIEAVKSWDVSGLRWLLDSKIGALSPSDLVRLFEGACSSGSYSCASSVFCFSASARSYLRGVSPIGVVGRVLCAGLALSKSARKRDFIPQDSMAAAYSKELREWLPEALEVRLVARHDGRDAASVKAFIDAAKGRATTVTFVETENGGSICGGYLEVAWVEGNYANDQGKGSFIFTLKNHLGVPPTRFAQRRDDQVAYMRRGHCFCFGRGEGFVVSPSDYRLCSGDGYHAHERGAALFHGDGGGVFRAARWELWEVC
jgi:hypothetical protein